jgi:hypothetical protein
VGRFAVKKKGLALIGEQLVRIRLDVFGIDDVFEIQDMALNFAGEGEVEGVTIDVMALPQAAYAWNAAAEQGTAPATTIAAETSTVPVPTGFEVTIDRITAGAQEVPVGVLSFDAPPVLSLVVEAHYRATGAADWIAIAVSPGAVSAQSPSLSDGTEYEFQVRHVTATGRSSDWTTAIVITPVADETAPGPVSSVSATGGTGDVTLMWTTPNAANFSRSVILRNTSDDEGSALAVTGSPLYGPASAVMMATDTGLAAGTYHYWIIAANASGVQSASVATGAVTVT